MNAPRFAVVCGVAAVALTAASLLIGALGPRDSEFTPPQQKLWVSLAQPTLLLMQQLHAARALDAVSKPGSVILWLGMTAIINFTLGALVGCVLYPIMRAIAPSRRLSHDA